MNAPSGSDDGAGTPTGARLQAYGHDQATARTAEEWADAYYLAAWLSTFEPSPPRLRGSGPTDPAGPEPPGTGPASQPPPRPPEAEAPRPDTEGGSAPRPPGAGRPDDGAPPVPSRPAPPLGAGIGFPALADRQGLTAALRPFHLRRRRGPATELDHGETARNYACALLEARRGGGEGAGPDQAAVWPHLRPERERAVELVLLIDSSLAMLFQQEVAGGVRDLLRNSGVFRRVRVLYFDSDSLGEPSPYDAATGARHSPLGFGGPESGGAGAMQVVLILTDGLGEGWRYAGLRRWLAALAGRRAVGIAHLLSPYQWHRSGIRPETVDLRRSFPADPARANAGYRERRPPLPESPDGTGDAPGGGRPLFVPVLPLRAKAVAAWARFVMGRGPAAFRGAALGLRPDGAGADEPVEGAVREPLEDDPDAQVRRFHRSSTSTAFELATALAVVPLQPELITAVCERVTGRSRPSELTEIFFSGLVTVIDDHPGDGTANAVYWDFRPEVRRTLLALGGRRSQIRGVLSLLAAEFAHLDPWFEAVGRMLRGEEDVRPRTGQASHWWAKWMRPALEAVSLVGPHNEFFDLVFSIPTGNAGVQAAQPEDGDAWHEPANGIALDFADPPSSRSVDGRGISYGPASDIAGIDRSHADGSAMPDSADSIVSLSPSAERRSEPVRSGRRPPSIWGPVPRRNPAFTGRVASLGRLRDKFVDTDSQLVTVALHGMSGVGKTELAKEYLHRFSDEYDVIWWFPASQINQIHESYFSLAENLGLSPAGSSVDHVVHSVHQELRHRQAWLLVFDSADAPEYLERFLPTDGPGHVIVTSRDGRWALRGRDDFLEINIFDRHESIELLQLRGPELLTATEADGLAEELGDLPLALNQAAVWLHESGISVSDYLTRFADKKSEMLGLLTPVDASYPLAVAAAWNVSLDQLAQTNRAALQLLQVLSFFAVAPVPRYVLNFARDIDAPPELRQALEDPAKLGKAIRDITRYSLAQVDHRHNNLTMHRLVKQAVQAPLDDAETETFRHCVHQLLAKSDPQDSSPVGITRYAELLPHVWASEAWDCTDPWVRTLVLTEIDISVQRGEYAEARRLGETVLALWREKLGSTHLDTLRAQLQLVPAYRQLGALETALELCGRTLTTLRETQGADSEETSAAEFQYSRDLRFAGRFGESLDVAAESYRKCARRFGEDDPQTLIANHFYSFALLLNGDVFKAVEQFRDVLNRREIILGHDNAQTVSSADGYSDALMEAGDYHQAWRMQEELVERIRFAWGEHVPAVLSNMRTLTVMQRRVGRHQESVELAERVWRRLNERFGPESNQTILAALQYSLSLQAVDRLSEALRFADAALEGYRRLLGDQHPHTAGTAVNRAVVLRRLGRVAEARAADENALPILREYVGPDHPRTLVCLANLAGDLFASGDIAGALELDRQTWENCRRLLTDRHPLTLLLRRNLAADRVAVGEDIGDEQQEIAEEYARILGPDHPATLALGQVLRGEADTYIAQI
ncbi:FxSxx-COOH system tetratricopeptide repeat protein [Streptomonospora sediminis]